MDTQKVEVKSQITTVTVYRDRAVITRLCKQKLTAGLHSLAFSDLPGELDEGTLKARMKSDVSSRLGGIDMQVKYLPQPAQENIAKLAENIQQRQDELAGMEAQKQVLMERRDFLQSMESGSREQIPKSLARRILDSDDARNIWTKLFDDLLATTLHIQSIDVDMREKKKELDVLQRQLADLNNEESREIRIAEVSVEMEKAGEVELELDYAVWGTTWEPIYDLRLDSEKSQIVLEASALVTQTTGENWQDVELHLSTANPEISLNAPEAAPLYISLYVPSPPRAEMYAPSPSQAASGALMAKRSLANKEMAFDEADEVLCHVAEKPMAEMESRGASVTYIIPHHANIPPDGQPHQVYVTEYDLEAKLDHFARPLHLSKAYLRAVAINQSDYFLPQGRTNLYRDGEYAGMGSIGPIRPGEELKLSLGVDERLDLKLIPRPTRDEKTGLLGKTAKQRRSYKLEVKSHLGFATKLEVEWELPISTNDDLKVKVYELKPQPTSQAEDGIAKFMLELAKEGKAELAVDWEVEYPRERLVQGMPD